MNKGQIDGCLVDYKSYQIVLSKAQPNDQAPPDQQPNENVENNYDLLNKNKNTKQTRYIIK